MDKKLVSVEDYARPDQLPPEQLKQAEDGHRAQVEEAKARQKARDTEAALPDDKKEVRTPARETRWDSLVGACAVLSLERAFLRSEQNREQPVTTLAADARARCWPQLRRRGTHPLESTPRAPPSAQMLAGLRAKFPDMPIEWGNTQDLTGGT